MAVVHPTVVLLLALAVVGVLILLLRWIHSRGHSLVARRARVGNPDEYGLLVGVAAPADADEAARLAALLAAARIRHTVVRTSAGLRLMVWPDDAAWAREVLDAGRH